MQQSLILFTGLAVMSIVGLIALYRSRRGLRQLRGPPARWLWGRYHCFTILLLCTMPDNSYQATYTTFVTCIMRIAVAFDGTCKAHALVGGYTGGASGSYGARRDVSGAGFSGRSRPHEFVEGKLFLGGLDAVTTKESLQEYCQQW